MIEFSNDTGDRVELAALLEGPIKHLRLTAGETVVFATHLTNDQLDEMIALLSDLRAVE